jgi:O-antigen/teichoic acid export membrane protein
MNSSNPGTAFLRHIGWNLAGQLAPLAAALVSIPILLAHLGAERFGLLTIGWMLIGYFSLFDLGIGRAMTQLVSAKLAIKEEAGLPALVWTGLATMFGFGVLGAALIMALSEPAIYQWLNVPIPLREEAVTSLYVLAPAVPMVVVATGLRGILEANQQFRAINLIRIPSGVLMFAAPLSVLPWTNSLVAVFAVLFLMRCATLLALFYTCWKSFPLFQRLRFSGAVIPDLMKFGGWMTVSNIVSPLMVQMDRFLIGTMLSLAAVAHYATPFEMVTKVLLIPTAITGVAFPAFSRLLAQRNTQDARHMYWRTLGLVCAATLPITLVLGLFAESILHFWLKGALPAESAIVMQILLLGVFSNSIAHVPFAYLQGAKRADLTAKIHLAEAPVYVAVLAVAVAAWGIVGAAAAWTLRVLADAVVMHGAHAMVNKRILPAVAMEQPVATEVMAARAP